MTRSLLAILAALALLVIVYITGGDHGSSLWPFAGRFHPLLVHLPIGILLAAVVGGWGVGLLSRWRNWDRVAKEQAPSAALQLMPMVLLLGAWSAVVTGLAGVLLADWGSYDPVVLLWHRRLGLAIPMLATLAWWTRRSSEATWRRMYPVAAAFLLVAIVVGGHLGGSLSRGEGYLTRYVPEALRRSVGLPGEASLTRMAVGNPDTTLVYDAIVHSVLVARCGSCHNPERKKGGLVLTTAEGIAAGGRQGKAIVPGRADDSEMIIRLSLPPGHTDAMPPDRPIPASELALLRWWIDQGASNSVTLGDIERPRSVRRTLAAYGLDDLPTGVFALASTAADTSAVGAARRAGFVVQRLAANTEYLSVDATNVAPGWNAKQLELLRPLARNITWLNLSHTAIPDSALLLLTAMTRLTRLHLTTTKVGDAGLAYLRDATYLEYLNLVDTDVSDEGLRALEGLSRLRAVYLWGTRVTEGGVARLQRALPRASIRLGAAPLVDPPAVAARESTSTRAR